MHDSSYLGLSVISKNNPVAFREKAYNYLDCKRYALLTYIGGNGG